LAGVDITTRWVYHNEISESSSSSSKSGLSCWDVCGGDPRTLNSESEWL
jgi:hypothetical protein